jgi:hypothetical protein
MNNMTQLSITLELQEKRIGELLLELIEKNDKIERLEELNLSLFRQLKLANEVADSSKQVQLKIDELISLLKGDR